MAKFNSSLENGEEKRRGKGKKVGEGGEGKKREREGEGMKRGKEGRRRGDKWGRLSKQKSNS